MTEQQILSLAAYLTMVTPLHIVCAVSHHGIYDVTHDSFF